jgi:pentapeptide MXKDX repeat protein
MTKSRLLLPLTAATLSLGIALAPAALAQGMKKDKMEKSSMSNDKGMKKDTMAKDKGMKKDTMSKDKMSDGMKK